MVVVRKNITVEKGARRLIDEIRCFFYITNDLETRVHLDCSERTIVTTVRRAEPGRSSHTLTMNARSSRSARPIVPVVRSRGRSPAGWFVHRTEAEVGHGC